MWANPQETVDYQTYDDEVLDIFQAISHEIVFWCFREYKMETLAKMSKYIYLNY